MYGSENNREDSERTVFRKAEKKYKLYYDNNASSKNKKKKQPKPVELTEVLDFRSFLECHHRNGDLPPEVIVIHDKFSSPVFSLQNRPASLPMQLTSVKTLNGTNFEDWKESLDLYLAITNMDLALREEEPPALTIESTVDEKVFREKWDHSNRVCLMVMKYTMEKSIRQSIPESKKAKEFLKFVGEKFTTFDKAQKGHYFSLIQKTKYDGVSGVREHIMKLVHYFNKLKSRKVDLGDSYLIWQVLESLPSQFGVLKTFYNTQKNEWTIDEMITIISQEEDSIRKMKSHSVQFAASTSSTKHEKKKGHKCKFQHDKKKGGKVSQHLEPKKNFFKGTCKYCKKYGHKVDDCYTLKRKLEKGSQA